MGQLLAAGCWWLVVVWGIWGQRRVWECEGESGIQHTADCESLKTTVGGDKLEILKIHVLVR